MADLGTVSASAGSMSGKVGLLGDIDTSDNTLKGATVTDSDVAVTTNNTTQIDVKDGGVLHYKDAAAVHAEAEERRKDWNNTLTGIKDGAKAVYDRTPMGMLQKFGEGVKKAGDDFMTGVDNIGKPKASRFDKAVSMDVPQSPVDGNSGLSK